MSWEREKNGVTPTRALTLQSTPQSAWIDRHAVHIKYICVASDQEPRSFPRGPRITELYNLVEPFWLEGALKTGNKLDFAQKL